MTRATRTRHLGNFRGETLAFLDQVSAVLEDLAGYWPLTLRQVYYQLVAALVIENNLSSYKKLSRDLAKARLCGLVPWNAIEDRTRSTMFSDGWSDRDHFIEDELNGFLAGYRRDLLRSQDIAVEAWIEKDALSHIVHRAPAPFCVPVVVAKGFASATYRNEARQRIERNAESDKPTIIVYLGDLDPSGQAMLPSMVDILVQEHGVPESLILPRHCALTPEQVEQFGLPHSVDALKKTDSRAKKYMEVFGNLAVELDSLRPATLEDLVRDAIEAELDLAKLDEERQIERDERSALAVLQERAH